MKKGVLKMRNKTLLVTVLLSTLMIELILVFLHGCSNGEGFAFDIDKQAFVVERGCACGGSLYISGEAVSDEFAVIYNKNVHAFWYDSYNLSVPEINSPPTRCNVVSHGDALSLRRLLLWPNTPYAVYHMSGCCRICPLTIKTDKQGRVVSVGRGLQ